MKLRLEHIKKVFFIGIGGIGMSALARYFNYRGCSVFGYDRLESGLTKKMQEEGMKISYGDKVENIPIAFNKPTKESLVVYTPAVSQNTHIISELKRRGFDMYKRSAVLGLISQNKFTIAIAGTHGKTTTSTLTAHILRYAGVECSAFLGGISTNYGSNAWFSETDVMVVEADEYDRSFLSLRPDIAVITSMEADHLDIYNDYNELVSSFKQFLARGKPGNKRIIKAGLPIKGEISYGIDDESADVKAKDIEVKKGSFYFTYQDDLGEAKQMYLAMPGYHNVENALAAISVAKLLNIDMKTITDALSSFRGVKRRFEYVVKNQNHIYIDDYAHHPEEVKSFLNSVKKMYPKKFLTVVFQPHLYSRTQDFADDFAIALALADKLLLLEIYPARELPIEGVTSDWLLEKVKVQQKEVLSNESVLDRIAVEKPELIVTMGAGNIDRLVEPIKKLLIGNE
ncbi:MAG TPA: UDP-N-acetylmuramate--L-alanine ligase [Sphingobacterium sp.]|nr:UDP-N-acetylmuramate--L-alanine ligase [Sphingobacterium sp.]